MAVTIAHLLASSLAELRWHPVAERIRARRDDTTVVDSTQARVVWEPRRLVPCYAVPVADVAGDLVPWNGTPPEPPPDRGGRPALLHPGIPFAVHSTPGTALSVVTGDADLAGAAFRPDDPDLAGHVLLDWSAFTQWLAEDEPLLGHPHDPFSRIDCLPTSRRVVVRAGRHVLADSTRAVLLLETGLPTRAYLPREDVRFDLLEPSASHTTCAYKGVASYWSAVLDGQRLDDIAWSYPQPLHDAEPVRDRIAFYAERLDVTIDGAALR